MSVYTQFIPLNQIQPNPEQPRTHFDEKSLAVLGRSLLNHGQQQPVVVEAGEEGFILIAGERRWRAAQAVGLTSLIAVVRPQAGDTSAHDRLLLAMIENLHRDDMGPIDVARGWQVLIDKHGYTSEKIALEFGKNRITVENYLGWLAVEPEIQELVNLGKLPRDVRVRKALLTVPNTAARIKMAQHGAKKQLSITGLAAACQVLVEKLDEVACPTAAEEPTPALRFTATPRKLQPQNWDALQEAGQAPSWPFVVVAIDSACRACAWGDQASPTVCGKCPVVALVRTLTRPLETAAGGGA